MESGALGAFAPDWAVAPTKARSIKLLDTPAEKLAKAEQMAGGLPEPEFFQNLPDHTKGPVTYAEELGREISAAIPDMIATINAENRANHRSHYGRAGKVDIWA